MIDTILKSEDLQTLVNELELNLTDFRIYKKKENHDHYFFTARIILTIPKNKDIILRHVISQRMFNSVFLDQKDSREYQEFRSWCDKSFTTAKSYFGIDLIEGSWSE